MRKPVLVDALLDGSEGNWAELVRELTHVKTRSPVNRDAEVWADGVVVQVKEDVLGPLGVLRSSTSRRERPPAHPVSR